MKFLKKTTQYQIQKHLRFVIGMASLGLYPLAGQALGANPDPKTAKEDPDGKTLWYDCKNMKIEGKGWSDTEACYDRLPLKSKSVAPKMVWDLSKDSTGMCIRFTTDAKSINVRWSPTLKNGDVPYALPHMAATAVSGVDLYAKSKNEKWQFKGNGRPTASVSKAYFNTTPGQEHLLYLPLYNGVSLLEIGIPKDRTISQPDAAALKKAIVFYGTSVTQGACASRPGMSSTAITGRKLDAPVINLGFSGSGKMEIEMAALLSELDPSIYVIDCLGNMTPEMLTERVEPFVKTLRTKHQDTPIVLVEDASLYNVTPTVKGKILRSIYEKLVAQGMGNLYFLPNNNMLGDDGEATVDGAHLNDLGMMRLAEVFASFLAPILLKQK